MTEPRHKLMLLWAGIAISKIPVISDPTSTSVSTYLIYMYREMELDRGIRLNRKKSVVEIISKETNPLIKALFVL